MAKRRRKGGGGTWWAVAALVVAAGVLIWWLSARRAEAPGLPASQPGARALSEAPDSPGHTHDEITGDEKADLQRIIRDGGAPSPGR
jgi:hypothetical protein